MADTPTLTTLPTFPFDTQAGHDTDPEGLRLLAEGSMVRARMANGGQEIWLMLGYHVTRQVMADPRFLREPVTKPDAPVTLPALVGVTDVVSVLDAPRHTRVRRLLAAAFTPRMIERLRPRIQSVLDSLLDGFVNYSKPPDLLDMYLAPLPITVICELLGVPESDRSNMREWAERFMAASVTPEEMAATHREVGGYLAGLIAAKRAHPEDDLTTALVQVTDEGDRLTEAELVINIQTLLVAGHETTINQLANGIVTLSRNPNQFDMLRRDPGLVDNAVEELLRYDKLVTSTIPWVAAEDVEVDGHLVKAGDAVVGVPHVANRDPAVFEDPNRLDITRPNASQHLSFIHGPHFCLGAQLARTELRMALAALLSRYPELDVAVDHADLEWRPNTLNRALRRLPVTW
ncbi:cytochrome P450 [Kibdelosporangium banguiense]|uniref:Cytochrome P450 n=1 Tax=Kibdelosporangium banguiense TaxID=1365924 RepID=A0ABS4TUC6_9PSEU|nr:cytochrome P450 [Kibdelosporangium banguiense]MBP2327973.1 cytochrome P450 [Kibdelosporangium banguiense]